MQKKTDGKRHIHKRITRKRITFAASIALSIIILSVIFLNINLQELLEITGNINVIALCVAFAFLIPPYIINTYRWKILISGYRKSTFGECLSATLAAQSLNVVTPSKLGDFAKGFFMRSKKLSIRKASGAVVFEKILDLSAVILFSFIGIIAVGLTIGSGFVTTLAAMGIILVLALVFLLYSDLGEKGLVQKLVKTIVPTGRLRGIFTDMLLFFSDIRKDKKNVLAALCLSILGAATHLFQAYLFFWAIGYNISFFVALGLIPIGILIGMIPITFAGMGTRDAAFLFLFSKYAPAPVIVLFSLLFSLRYIIPAVVGVYFMQKEIKKARL